MTEAENSANYLDIMIESLQKKDKILKELILRCEDQAKVIADNGYGDVNWDQFNVLIADKEVLIGRLNELDDGFEALYNRIGDDIKKNRERYSDKIKIIQQLIRDVTDKGVVIRASEERNRANLERVLRPVKKEIKTSKRSMNVINNYYNSMSGGASAPASGWIDRKK